MLVKAKKMSVGTIRKYGQSFYKKTANKGWQRVPTKDGRKLYEKQERGKVGIKRIDNKKLDKEKAKMLPVLSNKEIKDYVKTMKKKIDKVGKKKPKNKKVRISTKQPTRTKKTPTRMNVSNVTQQYIDKLKKIKIMNESGKRVYVKLVKRAIKNKDRKLLDQYLKEIDNWIKRDKKLKEGKKKKMDWRAVK